MSESNPPADVETTRTVVQTYVPAYQRDEWDEHADRLDMSRSEFVKTMVQAGRRSFDNQESDVRPGVAPSADDGHVSETANLEARVLDALESAGCLSWEELLSVVSDDIETRLDDTIEQLEEANELRYNGREGGYVLKSAGNDE